MSHLSHTEEENGADEVWGREEEGEEVGWGGGEVYGVISMAQSLASMSVNCIVYVPIFFSNSPTEHQK